MMGGCVTRQLVYRAARCASRASWGGKRMRVKWSETTHGFLRSGTSSRNGLGTVLSLLLFASFPLLTVACAGGEGPRPEQQTGADEVARTPDSPTSRPAVAKAPTMPAKRADLHEFVRMSTTMGNIILELDVARAPITVRNFLEYADDKFYDGTLFHRVIDNYVIQGGGLDERLVPKKTRPTIANEWKNGLSNRRGTISMAREPGQPDSANSQFFINVGENIELDRPLADGAAFAVFGKVFYGMKVVDAIKSVKTSPKSDSTGTVHENFPARPIVIKSVSRISEEEAKAVPLAANREPLDAAASVLKEQGVDIEKAVLIDSGLWYIDIKIGTGESPRPNSFIEVGYNGWLTDGTKFDWSGKYKHPMRFHLTPPTIEGWIRGVTGMRVGGKRFLVIPPEMGYGRVVRGGVPANSILIFEVDLLAVL